MRRFQVAGVVLAVGLAASGCGGLSTSSRMYPNAAPYPPTDPSSVELLRNEPSVPYVRLGEVTVSLDGNPSQQAIAQALTKQAAQMGATAVVLVYDGSASMGVMYSGPLWAPGDPSQGNQQVVIAVAIRYT